MSLWLNSDEAQAGSAASGFLERRWMENRGHGCTCKEHVQGLRVHSGSDFLPWVLLRCDISQCPLGTFFPMVLRQAPTPCHPGQAACVAESQGMEEVGGLPVVCPKGEVVAILVWMLETISSEGGLQRLGWGRGGVVSLGAAGRNADRWGLFIQFLHLGISH